MRRPTAALAALALAAGVGVTGAVLGNASQLPVAGGQLSAGSVVPPCAGGATASTPTTAGEVTTVRVTVPAGCIGTDLAIIVSDGSGTAVSGATQVTAATMTLSVSPAYDPATTAANGVAAAVDGWDLPVVWSYVAPEPVTGVVIRSPAYPNTTLTLGDWYDAGGLVCVDAEVFVVNGRKAWGLSVNRAAVPFEGAVSFAGADAAKVTYTVGPQAGWITVVGIPPYDTLHAQHDTPLVFSICG